jgi:hypothetical protein
MGSVSRFLPGLSSRPASGWSYALGNFNLRIARQHLWRLGDRDYL